MAGYLSNTHYRQYVSEYKELHTTLASSKRRYMDGDDTAMSEYTPAYDRLQVIVRLLQAHETLAAQSRNGPVTIR